jgi:hypothetical protein
VPQQGPPPYGAPQPYGQQPGYNPYGQPAGNGGGISFDLKKLKVADYVIAGGTLLYLICAILPWVDLGDYFGFDSPGVDDTVSGFTFSGLVTFSFVLFLLATVWAALPAFTDLKLGFPRGYVTVGLAGLGFILTLIAWIKSLKYGFEIFALVGFIVAAVIALFAVLSLLPELRNRPGLPGGLANAAQWANQQAPQFGQPGAPTGSGPAPGQQYGQPQQQPYSPPPPPQQQQYGQPQHPGAAPGGPPVPPPPPYGQQGPGSTGSTSLEKPPGSPPVG